MYLIYEVVLFKEITAYRVHCSLRSTLHASTCSNRIHSLLLSAKTAYACQQWLTTHYYLLPCNSINLHNSCAKSVVLSVVVIAMLYGMSTT